MKTKVLSLLMALLTGALTLSAQESLKIGYTNADYVLSMLPEAKQIDAELKAYEKQLQNQIQAKYNDLQTKMADYQENAPSWDDLIRTNKEEELQSMQQNMQKFQVDAETSMGQKRNTLLTPVYEKIGKAIEEIAVENGYSHIFSAGAPGFDVLLYAREKDDVSDLILKKLGITPPAKEEAQGN